MKIHKETKVHISARLAKRVSAVAKILKTTPAKIVAMCFAAVKP